MITDVAVVVPAADEQDEIAGCLDSVLRAVHRLAQVRPDVRAHVVVVLDACTDGTADALTRFPNVAAVASSARCVGSARRQGAAFAVRACAAEGLWLANTDADCRVPADWLTHLLDVAGTGADVHLGTVRPRAGLPVEVLERWRLAHDLSDGHPHVHGANLGISARAYAQLGGWRDLRVHEDVDLVERAAAAGCRIARTGGAPVATSSRLNGRTPAGFAAHLRALSELGPGELSVDRAS